jgi:hypothetical protein
MWAVKGVAIVVGGLLSLVSLMALVGVLTGSGVVRLAIALVVALGVPAFVVDRALPKKDTTKVPGLATDVFALTLLGFGFIFCGPAQPLTKRLLVAEGDRLAASGFGALARVAYGFGGVRPEFSAENGSRGARAAGADGGAAGNVPAAPAQSGPAASAPLAAPLPNGSAEETPAELFREWAPSAVCIQVKLDQEEGGGTGFLIDDAGTIATNNHVIAGARAVKVKLHSGTWVEDVELLTENRDADLALLRIKTSEALKPVTLGDSDAIAVGERIIAIGNPLGFDYTLTDGLVSSRRIFEGRPMIQMSVPVSPGNSGGPVFNLRGQVIGVTTLQITGGFFGRAQNLNMAVPINALRGMIRPEYPQRHPFGKDSSSTW